MSMRWVEFGKDYAPFMKLEFAEGKNMDALGRYWSMKHFENDALGR